MRGSEEQLEAAGVRGQAGSERYEGAEGNAGTHWTRVSSQLSTFSQTPHLGELREPGSVERRPLHLQPSDLHGQAAGAAHAPRVPAGGKLEKIQGHLRGEGEW